MFVFIVVGISELTEEEKEELLLRDVDSGCTQLKNAIAYYQGCIEKMTEEKQGSFMDSSCIVDSLKRMRT